MENPVKEFTKEISNLLFFAPKPTSRNNGHIPEDFKVTVSENLVNLAWSQEVMVFGEIYYHNINFLILYFLSYYTIVIVLMV